MSIAGKIIKGMAKADRAVMKGTFAIPDAVESVMSTRGGKMAARAVSPLKKDSHGPAIWNAYTGLKESKVGAAAALGAAGLYSVYGSQFKYANEGSIGQTQYVGSKQNLLADGVGHKSNAPTLGASGDMVFGMNNMRRG